MNIYITVGWAQQQPSCDNTAANIHLEIHMHIIIVTQRAQPRCLMCCPNNVVIYIHAIYFVVYIACLSYPCQNNGTCKKFGLGFKCECRGNFDGTTCHCKHYLIHLLRSTVYNII